MSYMYNKIFTKILDSSIWLETDTTRIVWMTFLAAMDEDGFAQFASVANLAHRARVTPEGAEQAVKTLESPDPNSSDPDNEGRRIERVPGGWVVLNATKYRELVTRVISRERTRLRVAKHRQSNGKLLHVTGANETVTQSEAVSVSKADTSLSDKPKRNVLIDALATVTGIGLESIGPALGARLGKAIKVIRESSPDVTVAEIAGRAEAYKRKWPSVSLTPESLAKHWASFSGFKPKDAQAEARLNAF